MLFWNLQLRPRRLLLISWGLETALPPTPVLPSAHLDSSGLAALWAPPPPSGLSVPRGGCAWVTEAQGWGVSVAMVTTFRSITGSAGRGSAPGTGQCGPLLASPRRTRLSVSGPCSSARSRPFLEYGWLSWRWLWKQTHPCTLRENLLEN